MYNPLIKIKHSDNTETYLKYDNIVSIENWDRILIRYIRGSKDDTYYTNIINIEEIFTQINYIEEINKNK